MAEPFQRLCKTGSLLTLCRGPWQALAWSPRVPMDCTVDEHPARLVWRTSSARVQTEKTFCSKGHSSNCAKMHTLTEIALECGMPHGGMGLGE